MERNSKRVISTFCDIFSESEIPPSISIKPKYYQSLTEILDTNYEEFLSAGVKIEENNNRMIFHNISEENNIMMKMNSALAMMLGLTSQISEDVFHFKLVSEFIAPYKVRIDLLYKSQEVLKECLLAGLDLHHLLDSEMFLL